MKMNKELKIGGVIVPILSENIVSEWGEFGAGIVGVHSREPLQGECLFSAGTGVEISPWMTGDVVRCLRDTAVTHRLWIRERSARLEKHFPMFMRNTTSEAILSALANAAKVDFRTDGGSWLQKPIPHFSAFGTGLDTLALIAKESSVKDFIISTNADGSIYLGSYQNSMEYKVIACLPESMFTDLSTVGATLPFFPGLRPGSRLQIGNGGTVETLQSIAVSGAFMRIKFKDGG